MEWSHVLLVSPPLKEILLAVSDIVRISLCTRRIVPLTVVIPLNETVCAALEMLGKAKCLFAIRLLPSPTIGQGNHWATGFHSRIRMSQEECLMTPGKRKSSHGEELSLCAGSLD